MPKHLIRAGHFYGLDRQSGDLAPVADDQVVPAQVEAWICRRVADYPAAKVPSAGQVASCSRCGAAIVYNPMRSLPPTVPKLCMQCVDIQPLPMDS